MFPKKGNGKWKMKQVTKKANPLPPTHYMHMKLISNVLMFQYKNVSDNENKKQDPLFKFLVI